MMPDDILIYATESVKDALKRLDKAMEKVLLVLDKSQRLIGTITDGDIRRYILKGESLDNSIDGVFNNNPLYLIQGKFSIDAAKETLRTGVKLLPILDEDRRVVDSITRDQALLGTKPVKSIPSGLQNIPIVIMAGGKSTRLDPFSRIFPKPLMPIGDKPIIEHIVDEFRKQGACEYHITLNYRGEMIKSYFDYLDKDYKVYYVWEKDYYGTAGSLKMLKKSIGDIFIVSNCDVIVKANFEEVVNFHKSQNAALTVLSSIQHYKIPYGVISFKNGGEIINIHEKPEYTLTINAGAYVVGKECIKFIPEDTHYDMTELVRNLIKSKKRVITYPVNESEYIDIGQLDEYKKVIEKMKFNEGGAVWA